MITTTAKAPAHADELECEFIPPLDAPESWGRPWDEQLEALRAWQEAGGNRDGQEFDAMAPADTLKQRSPVGPSASARRPGTISRAAANESYPWADRRKRVVSIDFPDRRRWGT